MGFIGKQVVLENFIQSDTSQMWIKGQLISENYFFNVNWTEIICEIVPHEQYCVLSPKIGDLGVMTSVRVQWQAVVYGC